MHIYLHICKKICIHIGALLCNNRRGVYPEAAGLTPLEYGKSALDIVISYNRDGPEKNKTPCTVKHTYILLFFFSSEIRVFFFF